MLTSEQLVAFAENVLCVLNATGVITMSQSEAINDVVTVVLGALSTFGIVNNMTVAVRLQHTKTIDHPSSDFELAYS